MNNNNNNDNNNNNGNFIEIFFLMYTQLQISLKKVIYNRLLGLHE